LPPVSAISNKVSTRCTQEQAESCAKSASQLIKVAGEVQESETLEGSDRAILNCLIKSKISV